MPAPAVIPAPLAYIKVVAVKKLVVEPLSGASFGFGQASSRHPPTRLRGHSVVHKEE